MKKYFKLIIISMAVVISVFVLLNAQQTKIYRNVYKPVSFESSDPQLPIEVNSKLQEFYEKTFPYLIENNISVKDYFATMEKEEFMEWAKLVLKLYYYQDKDLSQLFYEANLPFKAQLKERYYAKKDGREYNELIAPPPYGIFIGIQRKIEKELPFDWGLYSRALLMPVIEVIDKRLGTEYNPTSTTPAYTCKVIKDIKGNCKDSIIKVGIRKSFNKLEIGNKYLILISKRDAKNIPK